MVQASIYSLHLRDESISSELCLASVPPFRSKACLGIGVLLGLPEQSGWGALKQTSQYLQHHRHQQKEERPF